MRPDPTRLCARLALLVCLLLAWPPEAGMASQADGHDPAVNALVSAAHRGDSA
nr:hypothetical protein [Gammaproteobacteria bacterium]NIV21906.1 hypothetical protein [Gammaproteobacteria bacterium]NIX11434.1 hypothetical protein [Gammaproteobacteria bacterium]NIY32506.1 hypothetical protein [Gammaproteobacteria bacterium]